MARSKKPTKRQTPPKAATKKAKPAARKPTNAAKPAPKKAAAAPAIPPPRTLTPYLAVNDAASAIGWYKTVFGATQVAVQTAPGNKIMHAQLRIGDSDLFLSDIFPGSDLQDPTRVGPSASIHLWSKDIDRFWANAVKNGAKATMPLDDQFWGDRYGKLVDPFGHSWSLGWKSKLPQRELERKRAAAMAEFAAMASP